MTSFDTDVAVVGSGFGGSVTALRLTEKGYGVTVLEAGRRWDARSLPTSSWAVHRYLWFPRLGLTGIQRFTLLKDVMVAHGVAVGGGSVVYANTLYDPLPAYFEDAAWSAITDWRDETAPFYDQAKRMLGVTPVPFETSADRILREVGEDLGVGDTFHATDVGVWFGTPGETVTDPYFGGAGPDKTGCIRCGNCMVGCKHGAKNSLDTNYLHLAEQRGARVRPERQVVDLEPLEGGGYRVTHLRSTGPFGRRDRRSLTAEQVVLSGGSLGTQKLLFRLRGAGRLPALSPRLGELTRTNSEAITVATADRPDEQLAAGVAIGSSIHPDEHTHIEVVRYGKGSNFAYGLATTMVDGGGRLPRPVRFVLTALRHPVRFLRSLSTRRWSERSIILLTMQSLDNSLRTRLKRGPFGGHLTTTQGHGAPNPTWIPIANEVTRRTADKLDGRPMGSIFEATMDVPTTAHIIGGCPIGTSVEEGVVDPYHRVFGYPGLSVADGSIITANLGVNPSLSITAMAERAMALWPNRGEADPRPPLGAPYQRVCPVPPKDPVVPADAPGALRLPLLIEPTPAPDAPAADAG
ncbi:FAD-dependent oxidoreductase [Nitriliruptor alkaliphilus]|uniref:FAD-dependent oxidoreductase n=1 Tax=Nitriliruptor alkaliphilus TaxID=427918 RepID=UPI00069849DA|nr:GMC family oxidoreductase [Nitriliruptor alkaliphilus]